MGGLTIGLLVLLALLILRIEARLWRAGRLSDRWITLSILGRIPVLIFLVGLVQQSDPAFIVGTTASVAIPAVLLYRTVLGLVREQRPVETQGGR